jgi:DnaA family protein
LSRGAADGGKPRQLPLGIELDVAATFDGFLAEGSSEAVAALRQLSAGAIAGPIWIYGPGGSGKSHLLQATCRSASERGGRAMYLPLAQARQLEPEVLQGCESMDLLAIDDVDAIAGDPRWETALFRAVNEFLLDSAPLVLASGVAPREVRFGLPDLRSRASAHAVYRIAPLSDESLETLIGRRARERGLAIDAAAAAWLLRRIPRDVREIERWLERLDRASLAAQRRVTVALARSVLADYRDES